MSLFGALGKLVLILSDSSLSDEVAKVATPARVAGSGLSFSQDSPAAAVSAEKRSAMT